MPWEESWEVGDNGIWVALPHTSTIGVEALELSEGAVERAIEEVVDGIFEGAERMIARFEAC